jgi:hypothetical protein
MSGCGPQRRTQNAVIAALRSFGAALFDLTVDDLKTPGVVFQMGVAPVRVDVLTSIDGVAFVDAWQDRVTSRFQDQEVSVLSRDKLILNKRAAGRPQDLADVAWLEGRSGG